MHQNWGKLLFLHWSVPVSVLRPMIPRSLEIDTYDGGAWVSITPFGRIWDLSPSGIDLSFEAPFHENLARVASAIRQAHARRISGVQV